LIENEKNKIEIITQMAAFAVEEKKEEKMSIIEKLSIEKNDGVKLMNKVLCFQLAGGNKQSFNEYYKEMTPSEVWEMYAIKLATSS